jgi:ABC-type uncharacterized transport system auxiliary subunit
LRSAALALLPALLACLPDVMVAEPRYFAPLAPASGTETAEPWPGDAPLLRLRRVQSAVHLRRRIVWRRSEGEFGFRELERWTQPPADVVEEWLARDLFERRGLRRALAGPHPLLQVDVRAFDEVLEPERAARVELTALLSDARGQALLERTYVSQHPLAGSGPTELSRAMGAALAEVVGLLSADVRDALASLGP